MQYASNNAHASSPCEELARKRRRSEGDIGGRRAVISPFARREAREIPLNPKRARPNKIWTRSPVPIKIDRREYLYGGEPSMSQDLGQSSQTSLENAEGVETEEVLMPRLTPPVEEDPYNQQEGEVIKPPPLVPQEEPSQTAEEPSQPSQVASAPLVEPVSPLPEARVPTPEAPMLIDAHQQMSGEPMVQEADAEKRTRKKQKKKKEKWLVEKGKEQAPDPAKPAKGKKGTKKMGNQPDADPEKGKKKAKGKEKAKSAKTKKDSTKEELSEWSDSESEVDLDVFVVTKAPSAPKRASWKVGEEIVPLPSGNYQCHETPFLEIWPRQVLADKILALVKGTYPVLATMWGHMTAEGRDRILEAARFIAGSQEVELRPLIAKRLTNWVIIACPTAIMRDQLVKAKAAIHIASSTPVIFRKYRTTPHKIRIVTLFNVDPDIEQATLSEIVLMSGAVSARVIGYSHLDQGIRVVALHCRVIDDQVQELELPNSLSVETKGKKKNTKVVEVKKAPKCKGCHSEDHYIFYCPWLKVKGLRVPHVPKDPPAKC
jgi:hypothetical protein